MRFSIKTPNRIEWSGAALRVIIKDLEAWRNFETNGKNFILAYKIEKLRLISGKKNLSVSMLCDIIIMILKEGNLNFEYILDDFR